MLKELTASLEVSIESAEWVRNYLTGKGIRFIDLPLMTKEGELLGWKFLYQDYLLSVDLFNHEKGN